MSQDNANIVPSLIQEGKASFKKKEYHLSLEKYTQALELANKNQDYKNAAICHLRIARLHSHLSNFEQAFNFFESYLAFSDTIVLPLKRANAFDYRASAYQTLGDYENAYQQLLDALQIREMHDDSMGIARSNYKIGHLFNQQNNNQQAIKYFQKAQISYEQINKKKGLINSLSAIGDVYNKMGKTEVSLQYNLQSLQLAEEANYSTGKAYALQNIGSNYKTLGKYNESFSFLNRALSLFNDMNDKWGQAGTLKYLAQVCIETGQYDQAINYLNRNLIIANEINSKPRISELYKVFADVYEEKGNYKRSNEYLRAFSALKDTLENEQLIAEMGSLKSKYEIEKREGEIALLTAKNDLLEQEKRISRLQMYLLLGSAIALALLALLFFNWNRQQKKTNAILAEKNDQIADQNKQLETYNEELKHFAYVASHDLRAPLRTINSFVDLLKRRHGKHLDESAGEYMDYIKGAVAQMHVLLSDLLTYSRIERQGNLDNWVDLKNVLNTVLINLKTSIEENEAELVLEKDQLPIVKGVNSQMIQLFQNLISNALKYRTEQKPKVIIEWVDQGGEYLFSIKDNGIGIAPEFREKIFEMFSRLHDKHKYEGTGIGLATCKKIVERHGGRIWVEANEDRGSIFFFSLPKPKKKVKDLKDKKADKKPLAEVAA